MRTTHIPAAMRTRRWQTASVLTVRDDQVVPEIARHWQLPERGLHVESLQPGATSQVWLVHAPEQQYVAKLCFDTRPAFELGLKAAEHVERATGIATGAPIRTVDGDLSVLIPTIPDQEHPVALLTPVAGERTELDAVAAAELLFTIHAALRSLPAVIGHDPFRYLTDDSHEYAYQGTIRPALQAVVDAVRSADLTHGTCYGDGAETVRQGNGEVALLDWGGVLAGPVLWDVAEWMQPGDSDFRGNFQARLIDLGFVTEKEMALLPLVVRVRAARELRYRAFRFLHPDHYGTAEKDGPRIEELASELGIRLVRR